MPAQHPTDRRLVALIDGRLTDDDAYDLRAHLEDCALCQLRVGQARATTPVAGPALFEAKEVLAGHAAFEDRGVLPEQGDVWRLVWDGVNELGVVDRVDADRQRLFVMPVLSDVEDADEWCGLTELEAAHDVVSVAVSVALEASIPWTVLDARVGHVNAMAAITTLRAAYKRGVEPDEESVPRGFPVFSSLDPRVELIDEINDAFHSLAEARWGSGLEAAPSVQDPTLSVDVLMDAGLPPNRALALVRGDLTPTDEEAASIELHTGVLPSVHQRPIPVDLRRELDQPRWRPGLRLRMAEFNRSEADERTAVAYEALQPMAARGTHGEQADWAAVLDAILD